MPDHLWETIERLRAERDRWQGVAQSLACQIVHNADPARIMDRLTRIAANADERADEYAKRGGPVEVARRSATEYRAAVKAIEDAQEVRARNAGGAL